MNSQNQDRRGPTIRPLIAGLDSLYVGYHLDWSRLDWQALATEKERLLLEPKRPCAEIMLGGRPMALHRAAGKPYAFKISCADFSIRIGKRNYPNCYAQFFSEGLWRHGVRESVKRFDDFSRSLGARPIRQEFVSRADFAFDFHLPEIDFGDENFRSQAEKDARWNKNRTAQSRQFGKGDVVLRFYDKAAEIAEQSSKYFFYDLWGLSGDVWRIEWQVRCARFKAFGIESLAQLLAHAPELVEELSQRHTTLRRKTADSNYSRWPLHPLWEALIAATYELKFGPLVAKAKGRPANDYLLEQQAKSALGMLKKMAITESQRDPKRPLSLKQILARFPQIAQFIHSETLWENDIREALRLKSLGQ